MKRIKTLLERKKAKIRKTPLRKVIDAVRLENDVFIVICPLREFPSLRSCVQDFLEEVEDMGFLVDYLRLDIAFPEDVPAIALQKNGKFFLVDDVGILHDILKKNSLAVRFVKKHIFSLNALALHEAWLDWRAAMIEETVKLAEAVCKKGFASDDEKQKLLYGIATALGVWTIDWGQYFDGEFEELAKTIISLHKCVRDEGFKKELYRYAVILAWGVSEGSEIYALLRKHFGHKLDEDVEMLREIGPYDEPPWEDIINDELEAP